MSFQRILAGLDYSSLSQAVFEHALELAQVHQAKLLLFHCLTADMVTTPPPFSGELGLSPHLVNQAYQSHYISLEQQIRLTRHWLNQYYETARRQGIEVEFDHCIADPGQGLCQAAKAWNADLIVLGRRGRKGLTEILLGSVSNYVLHHADCAVLAIQAPKNNALSAENSKILTQSSPNQGERG